MNDVPLALESNEAGLELLVWVVARWGGVLGCLFGLNNCVVDYVNSLFFSRNRKFVGNGLAVERLRCVDYL